MRIFHRELPPHKTYIFHNRDKYVGNTRLPDSKEIVPGLMNGCTVAITFPSVDTEGNFNTGYTFGVGVSECSHLDKFCKKEGVMRATKRANKQLTMMFYGPVKDEHYIHNPEFLTIAQNLASRIFNNLEWKGCK